MDKKKFISLSDWIIKWCICLIVFAAPFSKSASEIGITIAIMLWAVSKILKRDFSFPKSELTIPILIYLAATIPSFVNTEFFNISLKAFFTKIAKFVFLFFVIIDHIDTREKMMDLFRVAVASMILIILDGFYQYFTGIDVLHFYPSFQARLVVINPNYFGHYFKGFPTACFPFPNDLAAWILLTLFPVLCVALFGSKNIKTRYVTILVSIGLFILFLLAKARGAWLGLAASFFYIALSRRKVWLVIILVIIALIPMVIRTEMTHHIFSIKASFDDRVFMWKTGMRIFEDHPVIGSGINTFFNKFKEYRTDEYRDQRGSYAHNCYLQMACDLGIVGLLAFLWFLISYFLSVIRSLAIIKDKFYNSALWGMSIGIFAFLIHSFFDTNLYSLNLATMFWTSLGLSYSIIKIFNKNPEIKN